MRVMVLFDLPVETAQQRKAYIQFRRALISAGFLLSSQKIILIFR